MTLKDMEALLQQEMEAVHGGTAGDVCRCETGAFVNSAGGECVCKSGAQLVAAPISCNCSTGAAMKDTGGIVSPPDLGCVLLMK